MIGTAIRKYAEAHSMRCDGGYAYGKVNGWHIAMLDSYGVKMLQIYLYPPDKAVSKSLLEDILHRLENCDSKEYRLIRRNAVNVSNGRAVIVFQDAPGTIKGIEHYIDEIMPRLNALNLRGNTCACCNEEIEDAACYMRMDDYILPMHSGCTDTMAARWDIFPRERSEGSLMRGTLGALLGAAIGAIVWAAVHVLGYVAGLVGLLIGFLTNFLYGRFGGRNSRVRVAVVIAAMLLGVIAGQVAGVCTLCAQSYAKDGGIDAAGLTRSQYLATCWDQYFIADQTKMLSNMYDRMISNIAEEMRDQCLSRSEFINLEWNSNYSTARAEALKELLCDMGAGLLFGFIGCIGLFSQFNHQTQRKTVKKLK